jgi:hypothetical protein
METETKLHASIKKVSPYDMKDGTYSLSIRIDDAHVNLSTYPWGFREGNSSDVSIFDLTKEDMLNLAQKIVDAAATIEG